MTELEYIRARLNEARSLLVRNVGLREIDKQSIELGGPVFWTPTDEEVLNESQRFLASVKSWPLAEDLGQ